MIDNVESSLESTEEEEVTTTEQIDVRLHAATSSGSTSVDGSMMSGIYQLWSIDPSRTSKQTENSNEENTQTEKPVSDLALPSVHKQAQVHDENDKRVQCDYNGEINEADASIVQSCTSKQQTERAKDENAHTETASKKRAHDVLPLPDSQGQGQAQVHDENNKRSRCDDDEAEEGGDAGDDGRGKHKYRELEVTGKSPLTDNERHDKDTNISMFDVHFDAMIEYRSKFGHCNVPTKYVLNPALGYWCSSLRMKYKRLQRSQKPNANKYLSDERIERLEKVGFRWTHQYTNRDAFEVHFEELMEHKAEFGHCRVSPTSAKHLSLGRWCSNLRDAYHCTRMGKEPRSDLTAERIGRLEQIGFKWTSFS